MQLGTPNLSYEDICRVATGKENADILQKTLNELKRKRRLIEKATANGQAIYGINTGFGALKDTKISPDNLLQLQENLILSHAAGVGELLPYEIVRAMMTIIANYLSKGHSGARPILVSTLAEMINKDVVPCIPSKGSVGSSGDLVPSAHMSLCLIGKGEAFYKGKKMSGAKALKLAGIEPLRLEQKEGLALINNTAAMTAVASICLAKTYYLIDLADICGALTAQALLAPSKPFNEKIHLLKPHDGQVTCARHLRQLLIGTTMKNMDRIQDQYSIRCMPQIHGAVREAFAFAQKIVNTEINSVTDNPLVFENDGGPQIISGGNFHGQAVSIAMDSLRTAVCALANTSDRRIASLVDKNHNFGLPAFLASEPGINSGLMIPQYTSASLVSENKVLAHPASVDSIPTSANVEDLVSMGTISARMTLQVLENVKSVLAIELITACQAVDFRLREGYRLSEQTVKVYKLVRQIVPFFETDCEYSNYIAEVSRLIDEQRL